MVTGDHSCIGLSLVALPVCQTGWASCRARPCPEFPGMHSSWRLSPGCWSALLWRPCEDSCPTGAAAAMCSQGGPRGRGSDPLHSRTRTSPPPCRCWNWPLSLEKKFFFYINYNSWTCRNNDQSIFIFDFSCTNTIKFAHKNLSTWVNALFHI